jgi:hypothetical protein
MANGVPWARATPSARRNSMEMIIFNRYMAKITQDCAEIHGEGMD